MKQFLLMAIMLVVSLSSSFGQCPAPEIAPWSQPFTTTVNPPCWTQSTTTGGPWVYTGSPDLGNASTIVDHTSGVSNNYTWVDFSGTDVGVILQSPIIDVTALSTPMLSMWVMSHNNNGSITGGLYNDIIVEASDGLGGWMNVGTISGDFGFQWVEFTYDAAPFIYGANLVQFRFRAESGGSLSDFDNDLLIDDVSVVNGPPAAPPTPTQDVNPPSCSLGSTIDLAGPPPTNDVWYWQTSATGTSTANPYAGPYTIFTNGTYYARTFNSVTGLWSNSSSSIVISNFPTAPLPPAPVAAQDPACVTTGTTISVAAPTAGLEYYWQGTTVDGTSSVDNATVPYAVGTTGTYYVSTYETATQCWSPTVGVLVTINTAVPPAPSAAMAVIDACSGAASIPMTVTPNGMPLTYTLNMFDSFGDGWNGGSLNILADGIPVLSGATIPGGSAGTATFTVVEGQVITWAWAAAGSFPGEISFSISNEVPAVVAGPYAQTASVTPYNVPMGTYVFNWYDAASMGAYQGSGSPFEAVGTGVMPTSALGTYEFYATQELNGCESATSTLVTVNLIDVNLTLTPIDETCIGYSNGSFTVASADCGTAPFTFSVDGGAFGGIPTDLTAGTYSVVVEDANTLQSNPITVVIGSASTFIPPAPTATNAVIEACSGTASILVEATPTLSTYTYTLNQFDSFGDGWNGFAITVYADGTPVLNNVTLGGGSIGTVPFTVNEGQVITWAWTTPGSFAGEITFSFSDQTPTVVAGPYTQGAAVVPYNVPLLGVYGINWYDAAAMGNLEGNGSPFEAVGTGVMPTATIGSYEFYATQTSGGCESTTSTLVTVEVADVLVALTPQDETCTGYADGTFSIASVDCGTAPFTFSVDGGAFGPAPTDLAAGTYSVVVQDAATLASNPVSIVIGTTSTVIPNNPIVTTPDVYACTGDASIMVDAVGNVNSVATLQTTLAAGNGASANMFAISSVNSTTITNFAINGNTGTGDWSIYYRADDYTTVPGANTSNAGWILVGTATGVATTTGVATPLPITVGITIPAGQTYSFHIAALTGGVGYTNGTALGAPYVTDANITIYEGQGGALFNCINTPRVYNGIVSYEATAPTNVTWYDAASGGAVVGTGSPFETVGTTVLPDSNIDGDYAFYVASELNGCYSVTTELVTAHVAPVNVELASIDADCNNTPTGSFSIANVICGTAPFLFSVDGGAFGAAPTDLMPGVHSIIVQDAAMAVSAEYFLTIGEAGAPSDLYMADITDNGGQVSWNSNGTETSWNVEWGLPGFIPGTGAEIGSTQAMDTFAIITGLDGNTNYDVYISANCGAGTTTGSWDMVNWTTDCGIYTLPFEETFEDNSITRVCWYNINEVGAGDWTYNTGSSGGAVLTAFEGTLNARFVSAGPSGGATPISKLASPRFDFAGQDSVALIFAYAQEVWFGDQNITKVYTAGATAAWTEIASYSTNVNAWTIDTLFISDTTVQIAFEGINNFGYANVVDHVRFMPCTLNSGIDGSSDVCRLDGTFDLNTIITKGEDFGTWTFAQNPGVLNGSIVSVSALPAGTFEFYYIVKTPCATDTTTATLTIFPPSSAGVDGTITACRNEPIYLLSGLTGNVDLGGQWYNPSNIPTDVSITTSNFPGSYNYDYIVSNGVCPNDTSNILVTVGTCDYLDIQELVFGDMNVYPNPTDGLVFISNASSSETFNYEILDVKGQVLSAKMAAINGTTTTEISLEKLEPGVYMIKVYNTEAEKTFRIIKQ